MSDDPITPALTPEEWRRLLMDWQNESERGHPPGSPASGYYDSVGGDAEGCRWEMAINNEALNRYYGGGGFTQEDAQMLTDAHRLVLEVLIDAAEHEVPEFEAMRDRLADLRNRITALLPSVTP